VFDNVSPLDAHFCLLKFAFCVLIRMRVKSRKPHFREISEAVSRKIDFFRFTITLINTKIRHGSSQLYNFGGA